MGKSMGGKRVSLVSGDSNRFLIHAGGLWISRIYTLSAGLENEAEHDELRYRSYC